MRVDFNVPVEGGKITDDTRLRSALPTIQYLTGKGAKVALLAHFDRPKGKVVPEMSLAFVAAPLAALLGAPVAFAGDCVGPEAAKTIAALPAGGVALLENVRFHAGEEKNDPAFAAQLREWLKTLRKKNASVIFATQSLADRHVALQTPDESLNDLFRFAVHGTDRFFLETPGLGTSYVAGYGTADRGWNGGHAVSGRPGYAWYFGRDSVWTACAALAGGLHDRARSVLEFLGRHQDLSGKILHELTTSGYAHFDAADAARSLQLAKLKL